MVFYARYEGIRRQNLVDHISGVVALSEKFAMADMRFTSKLLAYLHDFGKYNPEWQEYLFSENQKKKEPHSPYGAHEVLRLFEYEQTYYRLITDVLSYTINAHHGLFDALTPFGKCGLLERQQKYERDYGKNDIKTRSNFYNEIDNKEIRNISRQVEREIVAFISKLKTNLEDGAIFPSFTFGCLIRILLSILIDADWTDAGSFYTSTAKDLQGKMNNFSWEPLCSSFENYIQTFHANNDINCLRTMISNECLAASLRETGIYRLKVPTGGGKTLSVMRFALNHAKTYGKQRIIYVAPYKSIIDQTAMQYKKCFFKNQSFDEYSWIMVEHHGDVFADMNNSTEHEDHYRFLTDTWRSPIVLTTLVQFLMTLFSDKKDSIRRMHALQNSVIILDEFQSMPISCISIANAFMNVLSIFFGCTFVLCTATQPPFETIIQDSKHYFLVPRLLYADKPDLVNDYSSAPCLDRTEVKMIHPKGSKFGKWNLPELSDFIMERLEKVQSIMSIMNTRNSAFNLHQMLSQHFEGNESVDIVLLTNNFVPAHRKLILQKIDGLLKRSKQDPEYKLILISTSLVEAGVDLSFEEVIRSLTGLDSIAQAAGRCNRNNENANKGKVWVVEVSEENENINKIPFLKEKQEISFALLINSAKKKVNPIGPEMLKRYFINFYSREAKETHFPVTKYPEKYYQCTIFDLLDSNDYGKSRMFEYYLGDFNESYAHQMINQAFLTAGASFTPIVNDTRMIFVPWKRGKELEIELNGNIFMKNTNTLLREVQQYSLQVTPYVYQKLQKNDAVYSLMDKRIDVLKPQFYDDFKGLILNPNPTETVIL